MTIQEFIKTLVDKGIMTQSKATEALNQPSTFSQNYYGAPRNTALEDTKENVLSQQQTAAAAQGQIKADFLKTDIANDIALIGFYVNALAYGGYTIGDVMNDIKQRELYKANPSVKKAVIISPTIISSTYKASPEGKAATTFVANNLPSLKSNPSVDQKTLDYGTNIPDELYQSFDTVQGRDTDAFRDAVANVKSAFYDLSNAKLQAGTEQEKAVADADYAEFKRQVEIKYGIILSDSADKAWKQIEDLEASYSTRGIAGSGLQNEAVDDYLRVSRRDDQRQRDVKLTTEEEAKAKQMKATGTAAEIAALTPEERQKYGLTPSADVLALYDMKTLREKFPNMPEKELQAYRDAVIDENGNYRSTLYKKYYDDVAANEVKRKADAEALVTQADLDIKNRQNELDNPELGVFNTSGVAHVNNNLYPTGAGAGAGDGSVSDADFIKKMADIGITITQAQLDAARGTMAGGSTASGANYSGSNSNVNTNTNTNTNINTKTNVNPAAGLDQTFDEKGNLIQKSFSNVAPSTNPYNPANLTGTKSYLPATPWKPKPAPVVAPTTTKTGYQGGSIVDYLNSIGKDSSLAGRKALGTTSGVDYSTTTDAYATQNAALLKKLRGY